ncbi:DUF885 domain-containing protein [Acetobacter sp. AN02]|uniref:DUF885 domain-containing protein n=1 Tax=Acetobacter sp. AN02 TaxID=2894186 RepID=UPI0024344750|nr:DUF885 domain-containing protein [Acetobacter sp. AN02]MDG6094009.1 DUF885 domain-containing protein [Acetobacter sp. AN02]
MFSRYSVSVLLYSVVFLNTALPVQAADISDAQKQQISTQFRNLLDEQWQFTLKETPEMATMVGDRRYNDRWSDASAEHAARMQRANKAFLTRFQAISRSALNEQDRLSLDIMIWQLEDQLEAARLKLWEMPLDQFNGIQIALPGFVSSIPFENTRDYQNYLARLRAVPTVIRQTMDVSWLGLKDGLMQPRFLLEKVKKQARDIEKAEGEHSPFADPLAKFPATVSPADRRRLSRDILEAINHDVRPAYRRLIAFLEQDYVPHGRRDPGVWALPNGDAIYRYDVRSMTTTDRTPDELHELGLRKVAEIEREMTDIAHRLRFPDLAAMRASVEKNPDLYATSREEILDLYRKYIAQMEPKLPDLFGVLPKTKLEVQPVEAYREAEAADAEYHQGTPDGSRPGIVFVNTGDYTKRDLYSIEDTAYHEGVPGHHLQISIAQSLPIPPFRQQAFYAAYIEGWALYAERLGKEAGFYKDLYSDYGRLNGELLRADRLVLDTGVHAKHWSRQKMVDFFRAHPAESEPGMQAEVDRYIAWPGQALAYMTGQQTILELREKARKELGSEFSIRSFHDQILSEGAMPLSLLIRHMDEWIARMKSSSSQKAG